MVRTRANNAAMRKAVAAKAPRKQLAPSRPLGPISPSGGRSRKGPKLSGGNPAKIWPTPAWQKGIQALLGGGDGGECSSGSSSANSSFTAEGEDQPTTSKELRMEEGNCSSSAGEVGVALLDDDITQLNSDNEDH